MNLINNNPYRILGLPITADEKAIARQIEKLATYAEMGKTKSLISDFSFLTQIDRTPEVIEEAKKQIEQSESKLFYSLFWFWENNSTDELALEVLKEGNTSKAISIWEQSVFASKNKIYKPVTLFENLIVSSYHFNDTDDESHLLKRDGDSYIVERKKEDIYSIPTAFCELDYEDNWIIECDTTWLEGVVGWSYGIVFGRAKGSFYFFGINAVGDYLFAKYEDWTYNSYIEWKDNNNLKKKGSNNLRIEKKENSLNFFVNNHYVDNWQAEPFFGKNFGFKVTNNQKISFRNFRFSKLVEGEIYGEGINITTKNFSSVKNLSTLYLCLAINNKTFQLDYFEKAIALAKKFFLADNIEDYSKLIAGDKHNYNSENTLHFFINDIVDSIKPFLDKSNGISTRQLINAFSTFPVEAKQFLNNRFIAKQVQNIHNEIEIAETERTKSAATAINVGKTLVDNTKADIVFLKKVLGECDFEYQIIGDKLSLAIVQCGIYAFNDCKDSNGEINYPNAIKSEESYLNEYDYAVQVAATDRAKEKAIENLESCRSYIENKHYYYCWFCGSNQIEEKSKFEITIYNETSRDYFPTRTVEFSYIQVDIPRCRRCKNFHRFDFNFKLTADSTFGFWIIIEILIDIVKFIFGNIFSFLIKSTLKLIDKTKSNIKGTSNSTLKDYPTIKERLKQGWKFDKPKA